MNQRFDVLAELAEQFELAAREATAELSADHLSRSRVSPRRARGLALSAVAVLLVAAAVAVILATRDGRLGGNRMRAQEAAFLSTFPVLSSAQSSTARAQANSGPAGQLNGAESIYPVLRQTQTGRSSSAGIAPTLNSRTMTDSGSSRRTHWSVTFTGFAKYQNVPDLTREVTVNGVDVWFFAVYLPVTHHLPTATTSGNDPTQAAIETTPQHLALERRFANEFAGFQLYGRIGLHGVPHLIYTPRNPAGTFRVLRHIANASFKGPHGTIIAIVPAHVTEIIWSWPREFDSSALRFVPAITRSAGVSHDVAVARAPDRFAVNERIEPQSVVYRDGSRHSIARYVNPDGRARGYLRTTWDGSSPSPETAASRQAEHDPTAPNRVVIVPHQTTLRAMRLGPSPAFFFNVLLNHRTYYIRLTGGPRPGCIHDPYVKLVAGGTVDHPPAEETVRGDTFEDSVPVDTIHCAGLYRLSVSVLDGVGAPDAPFGSAAFAVR